jgi:hypothetical protein
MMTAVAPSRVQRVTWTASPLRNITRRPVVASRARRVAVRAGVPADCRPIAFQKYQVRELAVWGEVDCVEIDSQPRSEQSYAHGSAVRPAFDRVEVSRRRRVYGEVEALATSTTLRHSPAGLDRLDESPGQS